MRKIIIYSFKEYKEKYTELLESFISEYEDNDETYFLNEQIELYCIYKDNVTFIETVGLIDDEHTFIYYAIKAEVENFNIDAELQFKIMNMGEVEATPPYSYDPEINVETCKKYERSFDKILDFLTTKKAELEVSKIQIFKNTETTIQNKSLLFDGKPLNLLERFKIADKVLGIDTKIRTLNIADLEKYQLLAYILGCDKDIARNLMNGCYKAKARDLSTYFNHLDLNK